MFEEYDVVELLKHTCVDWEGEELQLTPGLKGTVIGNECGSSYLVEFADDNGETIAMVSIAATSLKLFWQASTESYVDEQSRDTAS